MTRLTFTGPDALRAGSTRLPAIPARQLEAKEALLEWIARGLEFPDYSGGNWDALEECLSDLTWIQERRVVLYHQAMPLASSTIDSRAYLEVLRAVVKAWDNDDGHEIVVAFAPSCEAQVLSLC